MTKRLGALGTALVALALIAAACTGSTADTTSTSAGSGATTTAAGGSTTVTTAAGGSTTVTTDEGPPTGGTLTVGLPEETAGWFPPTAAWGPSQFWIAYSLYDPLVMVASDGSFVPYLAESITANDDFTEWTLVLRPDVPFHDGSMLTAEVLAQNFELLKMEQLPQGEGTQAAVLEGASMEVVDDLTVKYVLEEPNAGFPGVLSSSIGTPFSMEALEASGEDAPSTPVGTGPFQLVEWVRDDHLTVERNPEYWQEGLPYVDGVDFRVVPEEETRLAGVLSGDLDSIFSTTPRTIQGCLDAEGDVTTTLSGNDNTTFAIVFNVNRPPLDDVRVRTALAHALDQEALIAVRGGTGILSPATQPYDSGSVWYSEEVAELFPGYDTAAAQALVEEYVNDPDRSDGKAVGEPISFLYEVLPDPADEAVHLAVVDMWSTIGVEATYSPYADDTTWFFGVLGPFEGETPFFGTYDVTAFAYEVGAVDPVVPLEGFFGDPMTGIVNIADHTSDEIAEGLTTLKTTSDLAARQAAVAQISTSLATEVPNAYAGNTVAGICSQQSVGNVDGWVFPDGSAGSGTPGGVAMWSQVWLDE